METQMPDDGNFLENMPEIGEKDTFCFDCGPSLPCFNRCCADLALPLPPYDAARLCRRLGNSGEDFLKVFTDIREFPETGFPLPFLRMIKSPDAPCPFVSPAGCTVYEDRPGACRAYPLGRGARLAKDGIQKRFFVVREDHCLGFECGARRTPEQWFECQGLAKFNYFNDRYMRLITMVAATEKKLEPRLATMATLCLYQPDLFRKLIQEMKIFERVEVADDKQPKIMEDSLAGDEACLDFALDWLELVIFGQASGLRKKGA